MKILLGHDGWEDDLHRQRADRDTHQRPNALIEDVRRQPSKGIGKPEALKGDLPGWWSRRITGEHRLVYRVQGRRGDDQRVEIIQCRCHS